MLSDFKQEMLVAIYKRKISPKFPLQNACIILLLCEAYLTVLSERFHISVILMCITRLENS